jgi:hypothetical protein
MYSRHRGVRLGFSYAQALGVCTCCLEAIKHSHEPGGFKVGVIRLGDAVHRTGRFNVEVRHVGFHAWGQMEGRVSFGSKALTHCAFVEVAFVSVVALRTCLADVCSAAVKGDESPAKRDGLMS